MSKKKKSSGKKTSKPKTSLRRKPNEEDVASFVAGTAKKRTPIAKSASNQERKLLKVYVPAELKMAIQMIAVREQTDASKWVVEMLTPIVERTKRDLGL